MKATKSKPISILTAMRGKTVFFNGTFGYGEHDRLVALTEAQQGVIAKELTKSVDILVLADNTPGKTILQKVKTLNNKGASIQVIKAADYTPMVTPSTEQIAALIKQGAAASALFAKVAGVDNPVYRFQAQSPAYTLISENFDGTDLTGFSFGSLAFQHCSFVGCKIGKASFTQTAHCDFTRATGDEAEFYTGEHNRFHEADLPKTQFTAASGGCDFTRAKLNKSTFAGKVWTSGRGAQTATPKAIFTNATLAGVTFHDEVFVKADFDHADLSNSSFNICRCDDATFRGANLTKANMIDCVMIRADLSNADFTDASLAGAELTDARVSGADFKACNLRGAKIQGVNFNTAKNYDPNSQATRTAGPALIELDSVVSASRGISIGFHIRDGSDGESHEVGVNSKYLRYNSGLRLPHKLLGGRSRRNAPATFSDAMFQLADLVGKHQVRYETVEVSSTKSPKGGKELSELVMNAIAEAFSQPVPAAADLAAATKTYREENKEQNAADRERREMAKKAAEKQKQTAKKQIARKIEKEVGKVTDIATFLKALELRADKSKIDKATKMLKAEKFQLFNDITDTHMNGVVKSQTDPDLVYACRIESGGQYACCTQNLNICGGLRGSICKHLLVLIIGLVKAGQLDPGDIDTWIAKTHDTKPELNKETMGEIFIRYKGAEAGEVDWRPTETVPEDYYAV
jgi:uncharacterized protein YjbI with pentapeptide repeats